MVLLRHMLGDALRRLRLRQGRTLREVSAAARVSLGYLSEVERGQKEASSELLASICGALGAPLSQVLLHGIWDTVRQLAKRDPQLEAAVQRRRAVYLEEAVAEHFRSAFPEAQIFTNSLFGPALESRFCI